MTQPGAPHRQSLINTLEEAQVSGAAFGRSVARVAFDVVMATDEIGEPERLEFAATTFATAEEDLLMWRPRGCTDEIAAAFTAAARAACGAMIRQYLALLSVGNEFKPGSEN
jgi:hypothetical protein